MPKKNRRNIVVDNVKYHYIISEDDIYLKITIQNADNLGALLVTRYCKRQESIEHLIRKAISLGWVYDKPGKIFQCPMLNP
jgi:hypothetical protein